MAEVAPELRHPVSGKTMSQLWDGLGTEKHPMQIVDIGINRSCTSHVAIGV
jgi:hypothetical protein